MGRVILIVIGGLALVAAAGVVALYVGVNRWLASDEFRAWASAEVSKALGVEGQFKAPKWSQSTVYSDGFFGAGPPDGGVSVIRADQIRAQFDARGIFEGAWRLSGLTAKSVAIDLVSPSGALGPMETDVAPKKEPAATRRTKGGGWKVSLPWLPRRFEMRQARVESFDLRWPSGNSGAGSIRGTAVEAFPEGRAWEFRGRDGVLRQPGMPDMAVRSFKVRLDWPSLHVTSAELTPREGGRGTVSVSGEARCEGERDVDFNVRLDGLPVEQFLSADWRARLSGRLNGSARLKGPTRDGGRGLIADGELRVVEGKVSALPVLDEIAKLTGADAFRSFGLDRAEAKVRWAQGKLTLQDIWIESQGLLRINGVVSDEDGRIDGLLEVGTTEEHLKLIPGARRHVFTREADGYVWAQSGVRLSGTRDQVQEDLTPRLASGAVREVQENVGGAVRGMLDMLNKMLR